MENKLKFTRKKFLMYNEDKELNVEESINKTIEKLKKKYNTENVEVWDTYMGIDKNGHEYKRIEFKINMMDK